MELPQHLQNVLVRLSERPTIEILSRDLIWELIARGLVERRDGAVHFTEAGKEVFHELQAKR